MVGKVVSSPARSDTVKNNKGQSTIEFIFSISLALGLFTLFSNLAINMAVGYAVHYATYMSSRTLLTYDSSAIEPTDSFESAKKSAVDAFNRYELSRFDVSTDDLEVNVPGAGMKPVYVGVISNFKKRMNAFRLFGGSPETNLRSESYLGKEPTRSECFRETCKHMGFPNCSNGDDITVFDNGC